MDDLFRPETVPAFPERSTGEVWRAQTAARWRSRVRGIGIARVAAISAAASVTVAGLALGAASGTIKQSMQLAIPVPPPSLAITVPAAPPVTLTQPVASRSQPTTSRTSQPLYPLRGLASWYGRVLHGHPTASGEIFDENLMTACNNSLPFGTLVKVTDLITRKSVVVRINDRGVLFKGRIIDLSSAAAKQLDMLRAGVAPVKLEVLGKVSRKAWSAMQSSHKDTP
jgi:rare lipoprotein A